MEASIINLLIDLVDSAINDISAKELVSTAEMTNKLLEIKLHLVIEQEGLEECDY
jgi:hypothetical protein